MIRSSVFIILLSTMWIGVCSCEQGNIQQQWDFDNNCWNIQDTIHYDVGPSISDPRYIYVNFLEDYPFRNLFLKLIMSHPSGWQQDTILEAVVVDSIGFWMIKKEGNVYPYIFPYQLPPPPDSLEYYKFKVTQYMRDTSLCEIQSAGVVSMTE